MSQYCYEITGGKIDISNVDSFIESIHQYAKQNNIHVQILNANNIYEKIHLESAIIHALRAYDEKRMSTKSVEMELLLYASGEKQLKYAIPKMGIDSGKINIALIFFTLDQTTNSVNDIVNEFLKHFKIVKDDSVLKGSKEVLLSFGITEDELKTVHENDYQNIILEHIAMVDIIK